MPTLSHIFKPVLLLYLSNSLAHTSLSTSAIFPRISILSDLRQHKRKRYDSTLTVVHVLSSPIEVTLCRLSLRTTFTRSLLRTIIVLIVSSRILELRT